jgi:hypothetical protein
MYNMKNMLCVKTLTCVPEAVLVVDALDVELDDKLFVFTAIEGESDFKEPLYNTAPD